MASPDAESALPRAPRRPVGDAAQGTACHNCGVDAPWNYCPNCGQETALALPSALAFLRDAAGRYIRLDGRMWRSLHALLFRPGFLTREYLAGRRRRYVRPARLFVALSIVLFAVLRFAAGTPVIMDMQAERSDRAAPVEEATRETHDPAIRVDRNLNVDIDATRWPWLAPMRGRIEAFNRLSRQDKGDQLLAGMFRYAPYAAVGLLPLFALMLEIVYLGGRKQHPSRPRHYAAHLVFGAHNHAFAFLVMTVIALVDFWPLRATLMIWALVYALRSLRNVYGGTWLGVVLRAIAVTLVYALFFALAVAALIIAAITFR